LSPSRLLRLAVAVLLTAFILWKAHPSEVLRSAAGADWRWIGAAVALVLIDRTLMAYRWMVLLCALSPGSRPPFWSIMRVFFVSTFIGTFLPSVGGDLYRAYSLSRLKVIGVESAASVLMDRVLGALSVVIVGVIAIASTRSVVSIDGVLPTILIAGGACLAAALVVFSETGGAAARWMVLRLRNDRAQRLGAGLVDAVRRYARHHGELANVLVSSIAVQVIRIVQAYCLGRALGIEVGLALYFAFIPVIMLIMLLPITINGLGTSQAAFPWLFGTAGVPTAAAVALSILFVALGIVGNLPGGLLYAFGDSTPAAERPAR
jgi:uncharacterized protein (TIRG00374 family)